MTSTCVVINGCPIDGKWFWCAESKTGSCSAMPYDQAKAAEWFGKATEPGHAEVQFKFGARYANDQSVTQDAHSDDCGQ